MWIKILIGVAIVVAIVVIVVAMQSPEYHIQRTQKIAAPAATVFAEVDDLHRWATWSPFEKTDPNMKKTFQGPESGVGASMSWAGNDQAGEGSMTIVASQPNERIDFRLDFLKPFKDTGTAEFTFKPDGDGTSVTWAMTGKKNFIVKAVHLFIDMDKMLGGEFEKGLADLKVVAEAKR